jgi:hypothetical protein
MTSTQNILNKTNPVYLSAFSANNLTLVLDTFSEKENTRTDFALTQHSALSKSEAPLLTFYFSVALSVLRVSVVKKHTTMEIHTRLHKKKIPRQAREDKLLTLKSPYNEPIDFIDSQSLFSLKHPYF